MLYMLGTLSLLTGGMSIDAMERNTSASIATKPLIGAYQAHEFTGEGDEEITLSGQILPQVLGGMNELETLHQMRRAGTRFPVLRGDGWRPGWFVITAISEQHREIVGNGVGFVVQHSITMVRTEADAGSGQQIVSGLLALFSAFRGA